MDVDRGGMWNGLSIAFGSANSGPGGSPSPGYQRRPNEVMVTVGPILMMITTGAGEITPVTNTGVGILRIIIAISGVIIIEDITKDGDEIINGIETAMGDIDIVVTEITGVGTVN